jgi:hypothetical protein
MPRAEMKSDQTKVSSLAPISEIRPRISAWSMRRPVLVIVFVSLLAVIINCYPVIFCGRSYVSPISVNAALVYDWWPPLPEMKPSPRVLQHDSDTGAMMWWGVPMGFVESRSIMEHGEIPLWNRCSHCGDILLGQAVSMLGDPLQLIVILGHGSATAWDIKFLAAKFLFCIGFGWLILRLLGNRPLSLIYAALAAYCGAYIFIDNHPAFFVLAYAPWILLSAIELLDLNSARHVRWGLVWLLANFACLNAGHAEMAVTLIGGLNLAALAYSVILYPNASNVAKVLGRMAVGTLIFFGLRAPMWMTFLVALKNSRTAHDQILVTQLPLASLPGVFDDLFYHLLPDYPRIAAPGTSLLVLVGCLLSALRWRQMKAERFFWVNAGALALWGGFVFRWIPSSFIAAIPLLNRVGHIHTDFSYLLVIHLTIQSAYGFKSLEKVETFRRAAVDFFWVGVIWGIGFLAYCWFNTTYIWVNIPCSAIISLHPVYIILATTCAIGAPLLYKFLKTRDCQNCILGWTGIIVLGFIPNYRFGLYNFGDAELMMISGPRAVLDAHSKAIDKIKADTSDPFRAVGLKWILMGDYSATYGIEDIRSCAPLWNGEYIKLIGHFPGMSVTEDWVIQVTNAVKAQPLLNLLNVKYLLADPKTEMPPKLDAHVTDRSDFLVMSNSEAWPRAFFSSRIIPISSNEEFIRQLSQNPKQPFIAMDAKEIEKQSGLQFLETSKEVDATAAKNYQLLPNSTAFDIHASAAGMVCLTEGQAQDFIATANNESKKVLTVNRAFKGVYLDKPGDYHVKFTYRPRYWRLSCALFWIATVVAIVLATVEFIRARNRRIVVQPDIEEQSAA